MKKKNYFRVVTALSLALAITILLWVVSPVMLVNAQGGYGGGVVVGGGGGARAPYPGVTLLAYVVNAQGEFTQDTVAESFDGQAQLMITAGTTFLSESGIPLHGITMLAQDSPASAPSGSAIVSEVYNFGPDGGIFNPPATLKLNYDPNLMPEDASAKSLSLAMFDAASNSWVLLDSIVDAVAHTVEGQIRHFTDFAILLDTTPAAFTVADLAITPEVVGIGEEIVIKALVTNSGSLTGSYEVTLAINDINNNVVVETKEVTLIGKTSQVVIFTVTRDVAGTYAINADGLTGTFEVRAAAPSAPPSPVVGISWYLIGGIIAGIVIIGVIVGVVFRSRKSKSAAA